jgi:hypothetical protein
VNDAKGAGGTEKGLLDFSGWFKRRKGDEALTKKGLYIGIDQYDELKNLAGCVNDATRMCELLARNGDKKPNLVGKLITSGAADTSLAAITKEIRNFFESPADLALLYFSGHGTSNELDGYLATKDAAAHLPGFSMNNLLALADNRRIAEVVIIIDCCHGGAMGEGSFFHGGRAILREGISILTAARPHEPALEKQGSGVFTGLLLKALQGGASDPIGDITAPSLYAYVDGRLGPHDRQRPMFKTHVSRLLPLRNTNAVDHESLQGLVTWFPTPDHHYKLYKTYEPTEPSFIPDHGVIFSHFQKLRDGRLLEPVGADALYWAAYYEKHCRLTEAGQHYWHVAKAKERI